MTHKNATEDAAYVADRNSLIPLAEAYADRIFGKEPPASSKSWETKTLRERYAADWNRAFHRRMNQLAETVLAKKAVFRTIYGMEL